MLAKIGTFILDYVLKRFWSWLSAFWKQKEKVSAQDKSAEEKAVKYEQDIKDPAKQSREERRRAEDTYLNG